ncbi:MAG: carboxypeptidase-like regulatory domain-containing protein, partial [Pyrinomonadaceae bacterium]|nr:carboxypeptidase-like regulatory domain-containing protein [Pyrinomonadaceae bacterium]
MSENFKLTSRQHILPIKVLACFFGLLLGFFVFSPEASMQDEAVVVSGNKMSNSVNRMMMNGNYRPTPEPPKSTIRGRVIYADTGGVVRRAGLMLLPSKGSGGGRENAGLTNERGEFEIKNVAAGRYFVSVNIPGVVTPFSALSNFERIGSMQNNPEMADVTRDFQEVVVNGLTDIDITVAARRGAAISGRIIYADGESAIGVRVEVLRKKDGKYSAVIPNISEIFGAMFGGAAGGLKTDDRGVFRIAGLPAGDYIVRVMENVSHSEKENNREGEMMSLLGFNPNSMVATYYPNTDDVKKAEIVKIELGQERPEVNITIPNQTLHTINGIVINKATRQPVKGARVSIKNENAVTSLFSAISEGG